MMNTIKAISGAVTLVLLLGAGSTLAQDDLTISNVVAQQRPGTNLVDITYDLETVAGSPVWVNLFLSTDAGETYAYRCQTVSGDVGLAVEPGSSLAIVWDAGEDYPGFSSLTCRMRVTAYDGSGSSTAHVAPGSFTMGSPTNELGRSPDETQHVVTLTRGIDVRTTEVTNQQFMEAVQWAYDLGYVTATNSAVIDNLDGSDETLKLLATDHQEMFFADGEFTCINPDHPVTYVTWFGAAAFCDWLSLQQGLPRAYDHQSWECNGGDPYAATGYRLPTEAEWEFACRAGASSAFSNGGITQRFCTPIDPNLNQVGWYCGNAGGWTHPVAQKSANAWGLHDMHANAWEWCNDWYAAYDGDETDPLGPATGNDKVLRGGDWFNVAMSCRSAFRRHFDPAGAPNGHGFRTVRTSD